MGAGSEAVAATTMSNLGLENYLDARGITLHRTRVGDRYVVEKMRELDLNVGGEQSGHIILSDFATTGDGLLAALQVLVVMCRSGRPLSELGRCFAPVPQQLRNLKVVQPVDLDSPDISCVLEQERGRLGKRGRLVVRPSGTEPKLKCYVEVVEPVQAASDLADARTRAGAALDALTAAIATATGLA